MANRNEIAKVLRDPRYRKRIERKAKGRASYTRKDKHKQQQHLKE